MRLPTLSVLFLSIYRVSAAPGKITCPADYPNNLCCLETWVWSEIRPRYHDLIECGTDAPPTSVAGTRCHFQTSCFEPQQNLCCRDYVERAPTESGSTCELGTRCIGGVFKAPIPTGWEPLYTPEGNSFDGNCYVDVPSRIITSVRTTVNNVDLTPASCLNSCQVDGYAFAGVEAGNECHCGHGIAQSELQEPKHRSECRSPCPGNNYWSCGGGWRIELWKYTT